MREVKFRAWNKITKCFFIWDITMGFQGTDAVWEDPEQFTGLRDKNGREIWENDVVTWGYGDTVVRFGTMDEEDSSGNEYSVTGWLVADCSLNSDCEVIGNIHEVPQGKE